MTNWAGTAVLRRQDASAKPLPPVRRSSSVASSMSSAAVDRNSQDRSCRPPVISPKPKVPAKTSSIVRNSNSTSTSSNSRNSRVTSTTSVTSNSSDSFPAPPPPDQGLDDPGDKHDMKYHFSWLNLVLNKNAIC